MTFVKDLPRRFKPGRIGVSDVPTEPDGEHLWTTRWTGQDRDIPMPLGTAGGYVYRRDASGWIYPGPSAPSDQQRFLILGSTFLPAYGEHEGGPDALGHEYDMLLRLDGGKEMPVEQVIALGFATKSPEVDGKPVWRHTPLEAFPQLEGVEYPPRRQCKYCPRDLWSDAMEFNHVSIMHRDQLSHFEQSRAIAEGMAEALTIGRAAAAPVVEPVAAPVVEPVVEPAAPEPLEADEEATMLCGICHAGFNKIPLYLAHVKQCKERRNAQES